MRFEFTCPAGHRFERLFRADAGADLLAQPCACGATARRVFHPVAHRTRFRAGWCGAVDRHFGTQREQDEYMARNDLVVDY